MIIKSPLQLNIQLQSKRKRNPNILNRMTIPCSNNDEYIYSHSFQKHVSKYCLDVDCGNGQSTFELSCLFPDSLIIGIDQKKENIQNAKKNYGQKYHFLCHTFSQDFFASNSFDIIQYNNNILNESDLFQIKRILKHNGLLIFTKKCIFNNDQFIHINTNSFLYRKE
jgi:SAM-dependent methyltransferase